MNNLLTLILVPTLSLAIIGCAADETAPDQDESAKLTTTTSTEKAVKQQPLRKQDKNIAMTDNTPPPQATSKGEIDAPSWYEGTLKFIELEGGFYGFYGDNGERFLPLDLKANFKKNGAKVKLYGLVDNNIMTFQQWGSPFKVIKVELISEGSDNGGQDSSTY